MAFDSQQVAKRLKERDSGAMGEVYDQYGGLLYSIVLRSVSDRGVAEDLLQEIFFRIWNRVHTFDDQRGCFQSWVVTVARHRAIDHLRASRNRVIVSHGSLDDLDRSGWFFPREPEAERIARKVAVQAALKALNKEQRQVLELTYFQGLTQTEIAAHLERPLGTVKSLVRAALKILRATAVTAEVV